MPIEKEKYAPRGSSYAVQERFAEKRRQRDRRMADRLHAQCHALMFDVENQDAAWKNEVAQDLMTLLGRAEYFLETSADESDIFAARATLRIVKRVAEFEGIGRTK